MGWFVRVKNWIEIPMFDEEPILVPGPEYFLLMSYNLGIDETSPKLAERGQRLCAFEVFLFGPVTRPDDGGEPWAGIQGAHAVNSDGNMLEGVPVNIARISNYDREAAEKAGTDLIYASFGVKGRGCFACHEVSGKFPQTTKPFPWVSGP